MTLYLDGIAVNPEPGESLLKLVVRLGLDDARLSKRPLAAKIAGEVFNLNYIPVREKDVVEDRTSIRRAMAASDGVVQLLRYDDPAGRDVYARTAQFMVFLALHQLYPQAKAKMNCTVGPALFVEVVGADDFSAQALKEQIAGLVKENASFERRRMMLADAIRMYQEKGNADKARLLGWRREDSFDQYVYGDASV